MSGFMSRRGIVGVWFGLLAVIAAGGVLGGMSITVGTGALMLAASLVPPAVILMVWPGPRSVTAAEVLHPVNRRA